MWIFTKHGFYSVVSARQGEGGHGPVDPARMMIRARSRRHLESLRSEFSELLESCDIREFANSDYAFRIFVAKSVWVELAAQLAGEIDYDNFKSRVSKYQGKAGEEYSHSLHKVWSVMNEFQHQQQYPSTP